MKKIAFQGFCIIILFLSIWWILSKVNWVSVFQIEKISNTTEKKLGDLFWNIFNESEKEIKDERVINAIDSLITKICIANKIERNKIKLHLIDAAEVNAFAFPDGHLVINSGLILAAKNQEELSGVIAHELAHIQLNHVMKKLTKEIGLTVLISMASGKTGSEIILKTSKTLSSTAFDRNFEKEADLRATDYLINSDIHPKYLANFLNRLSKTNGSYFTWLSTHPDSKKRSETILETISDQSIQNKSIITNDTWLEIKKNITIKPL